MSLDDAARKIIFNPEIRSLLLYAKAGRPLDPSNPFTKLVEYQLQRGGKFQIGEPFTGDIENANVLVVSSNPAYNPNEDSPVYDAENDCVIMPTYNFTENANWIPNKHISSDNVKEILENFNKIRKNLGKIPVVNGDPAPVRYWTNIQNFVNHILLGRPFALTEVVQYRSNGQVGVQEALKTCWEYAKDIISCSAAKVIVITAKASALQMFKNAKLLGDPVLTEPSGYPDTNINLYKQDIGGIERLIFNARYRQSVTYRNYFMPGSKILQELRAVL